MLNSAPNDHHTLDYVAPPEVAHEMGRFTCKYEEHCGCHEYELCHSVNSVLLTEYRSFGVQQVNLVHPRSASEQTKSFSMPQIHDGWNAH